MLSCCLSFISNNILTFILLVIRSGSRLIRLVVACCLIRPSFACPAQQQGKPLCFYFPDPRCGHRRLRARARRRSGTGPRCCPRRRRVSAAVGAWAGAGRGEGGGGRGMRASDIGGVGGPGATPAPGPSPQRHRRPVLPAPPLVWAESVTYCNKNQSMVSSILA